MPTSTPRSWAEAARSLRPPARGGGRDPAARHPPGRRHRPAGQRGARGLRRPVLGAAAALPLPDLRRPGHPRPAAPPRHRPGPRARSTSRPWTGPRAACWACTTSRPSAGAGPARRPCAPCSTTAGTARPTARSRPRSSPTRSATAWCGRWSGRSCPWGRDAWRSTCRAQVLRGGVRDSRVRVMPPHGLSLEEVALPARRRSSPRVPRSRGCDGHCPAEGSFRAPLPDRHHGGGAWWTGALSEPRAVTREESRCRPRTTRAGRARSAGRCG